MLDNFIAEINAVEITTTSAVVRLALSLILGSLVGMERKRKGQDSRYPHFRSHIHGSYSRYDPVDLCAAGVYGA